LFLRNFGRPDLNLEQIDTMREIIIETGALAELETLIEEMRSKARVALKNSEITEQAASLLDEMAVAATARTS
jgi:geranylgeranyl diphosphate synthase type I